MQLNKHHSTSACTIFTVLGVKRMLRGMHTQLYIDGQWVDGIGKLPVCDPSDGSVIAEVALAGDAQCDAAIAAADAAAKAWAKTAPRYRSEILRKAFELMTAENEVIATLISRENGKACLLYTSPSPRD